MKRFLGGLAELEEVQVCGITDHHRLEERVATVSFTHENIHPAALARRLGEQGMFVWHGNYYALNLTETLELEPHGMVRVGLLHYNTVGEVDRLLEALRGVG